MILAPTLTLSAGAGSAIVRPTFSRDFAGEKTLNNGTGPAINFTRASGGTFFDADGVLQTAADNVPRFDHDPVTKVSRGLLIEEQRVNRLLNSATLSTQSVSTTGQQATLSFYGTGSIALSGSHTATLVGAGAFPARAVLVFTPETGTLTLTVTGDVQYAQLETGAFPTSYIPTTGATATRTADSAVVTPISSFYNQAEGTLFAEFVANHTANPAGSVVAVFDDNTNNNRIGLAGESFGISPLAIVTSAGANQLGNNFDNLSIATGENKSTLGYKVDDVAFKTTATPLLADTTATIPATLTHLRFAVNATGSRNWIHIRKIAYWPKRLSNTLLEQLTT